MIPLMIAVVLAFAVETVIVGAAILWLLRKLRLRQNAYEDAPESHQKKSGTPTMGGLLFFVPLVTLLFLPIPHDSAFYALFFLIAACGAVGFLDDYMSVARGRNLGLRARTKFLATALIAIIFLRWISDSMVIFPRDTILLIGNYSMTVPHWFWLILGIVAITGTIHAVNLTDGLDGLAAGTILPPLIVLAVLAVGIYGNIQTGSSWAWLTFSEKPFIVMAMTGGVFGFLLYNRHPAKMFMGDTGSLALGALLSGATILTGEMLLLIVIGGVFVAEALSVILQVVYFKVTHGKRIFRMSPLHHHFELGGWPETKVTTRFWLASLICSAIGLAIVR
jgi:phospho-N-acetylmuramoyl-pentapeptide-transferase